MKRALILQNYPCEDAATVGQALERFDVAMTVVDCYGAPERPGSADGDLMVVLGGPMNACDDAGHPFLAWESEWIGEWVRADRPLLGICLGAQLLSRAMGGAIRRNRVREIGHCEVTLTLAGLRDPLFDDLPSELPVAQWHQDMCTVPPWGVHLARSEACENQAFRVNRAVGLQFHLEIGRAKMASWLAEYANDPIEAGIDADAILRGFRRLETTYIANCHRLVQNFLAAYVA